MTLPAGLATVTVTATFLDPLGDPRRGTVTFEPSVSRLENDGAEIIVGPVEVALELDGSLEVTLPATDAFDYPTSFAWRVIERLSGVQSQTYGIELPQSLPASVDLASLDPVVIAPQTTPTRGEPGPSAYDVAVANGFVGTEAEWLESLNGDDSAVDLAPYALTADVTTAIGAASTADRARANHTGTQIATTISDLAEAIDDRVAQLLGAGSNLTLNYDDTAGTLTISAVGDGTGLDAEAVRDAIGVALVGAGLITVTVNDALDTITISTTATANATDAALRDRSTHTGTQSADTVVDGVTNKVYTATEKTKLAGIASGATANSSDATLLNRANHTGTQTLATISDAGTAAAKNTGTNSGDVPLLSTGGRLPIARVASGTPDGTKFVRDDGTLVTPPSGGGGVSMVTPVGAISGEYVTTPGAGASASSFAMTLNQLRFSPVYIAAGGTFDRLAISVSAATASALIRLGIYAPDASGRPGALLLDAGTVSGAAVAFVEAVISQALTSGLVYWLASVAQTAAPSVLMLDGSPAIAQMPNSSGANAANYMYDNYSQSGVTGALPANATPIVQGGKLHRVLVRKA